MSLFLGKIHFWLYSKILWAEKIEKDIVDWGESQGIPVGQWITEAVNQFGTPTDGKPLEEIIDTSNIHGWLQSRIESAELRQAYIVTKILDATPSLKDGLVQIFKNQGAEAAEEYTEPINTPEEGFKALNDFIVEGMPCDRVNEIIQSDEKKIVWRTTECLHKPYWDQVGGDIDVFYTLRSAWVTSFIESISSPFTYNSTQDAIHEIIKN